MLRFAGVGLRHTSSLRAHLLPRRRDYSSSSPQPSSRKFSTEKVDSDTKKTRGMYDEFKSHFIEFGLDTTKKQWSIWTPLLTGLTLSLLLNAYWARQENNELIEEQEKELAPLRAELSELKEKAKIQQELLVNEAAEILNKKYPKENEERIEQLRNLMANEAFKVSHPEEMELLFPRKENNTKSGFRI